MRVQHCLTKSYYSRTYLSICRAGVKIKRSLALSFRIVDCIQIPAVLTEAESGPDIPVGFALIRIAVPDDNYVPAAVGADDPGKIGVIVEYKIAGTVSVHDLVAYLGTVFSPRAR